MKNERVDRDQADWWAITIDCEDPRRVAEFWSSLLQTPIIEPGRDRPNWLRLQPYGPRGPFMNFQPVDEPKVGKVRIHLDVLVHDLEIAAMRVTSLGGSDTGTRENRARGSIAVMRDPGGNEFCLLSPPTRQP